MSISPSDRNLIDAYIDGGIVFAGLDPAAARRPVRRELHLRAVLRQRPRPSIATRLLFTGVPAPIRDYETNLELTYMAQIVPGWTVQPNLQFIWHPSGDATQERHRGRRALALAILIEKTLDRRPASSRPASAAPAAGSGAL